MFEEHKLLLSVQFAVRTRGIDSDNPEEIPIDPKEWEFFIKSSPPIKDDDMEEKPNVDWLTDRSWNMLCEMDKTFDPFKGITRSIKLSCTEWERYYKDPEHKEVPVD